MAKGSLSGAALSRFGCPLSSGVSPRNPFVRAGSLGLVESGLVSSGLGPLGPGSCSPLVLSVHHGPRPIPVEENPGPDSDIAPDWLGTALCYAAPAGGHPLAAAPTGHPKAEEFPLATTALLAVGSNGRAVLSFTDVSNRSGPMSWSMTFDRKSVHIKVGYSASDLLKVSVQNPRLANRFGNPRLSAAAQVTTSNPSVPVSQAQ